MDWQTQRRLLSRHMPIVRFDSRELFFPIDVDRYITHSSLSLPNDEVLSAAAFTEEQLDYAVPTGAYLQFVSESERRSVVRAEARRLARKLLGPRLGRVGLFGRILDALFLLSVFVRPTTPRLTTAAIAI